MRLQMEGTYSLEEFEEAIRSILIDFKSSKIDSLKHINIYVQPCVSGQITQLMDGKNEVEHMIYGKPHPRQVSITSDNLKVVPSHKNLSGFKPKIDE